MIVSLAVSFEPRAREYARIERRRYAGEARKSKGAARRWRHEKAGKQARATSGRARGVKPAWRRRPNAWRRAPSAPARRGEPQPRELVVESVAGQTERAGRGGLVAAAGRQRRGQGFALEGGDALLEGRRRLRFRPR